MRTQIAALTVALLLTPALAQAPAPQAGVQPAPQPSPANAPAAASPTQPTGAQDHQHMMDLLGITALRPGVAQNGQGPQSGQLG
jgi:hypothetical protein